MLITLALPWTGPDGVEHLRRETLEVDDITAGQLIRDGAARAAGRVEETPVDDEDESQDKSADVAAEPTPVTPPSVTKPGPRRPSAQTNPESPATGANSEGVS